METNKIVKYIGRITYSHVIAYFIAGIFALFVMDYKELFATKEMSLLMRPVSDPIVTLGPFLQLFRGMILAIFLLPIQKVVVEEKYGFAKLGVLILGLSLFSTIGPTPGSFEGYIYTIIPAINQLLGYPEAILYVLIFISLLWCSYKQERKWIDILSAIVVLIISTISVISYCFTV
ncbi:hypothetical protein LJC57_02030 [Parabacteroides sp. OttesenSCG-928-G07]|nr:hypothetical protein [Parabacteroides sp. OttesenSCG-928-G21]MDL2277347.1 hypothetical protein [Parabacteroides sp. OttesenSCG-928-G07]